MKSQIKIAGQVAVLTASMTVAARAADNAQTNWLDNTISPVANPIYFEDPNVTSEVRPIYMYNSLPNTFHYSGGSVPLGGQVQVTALQIRYALTDRLGLIASKDGYIEFQPKNTLGHGYGWADLAAGLKYELIVDQQNQFILTPGFTFTVPTGSRDVYQGDGSGEWNLFASAEKGFDQLHLTANAGFIIPDNFAENTSQLHFSGQADYHVSQYFIPFVVANGYTILSNGNHNELPVPLNTEGYDLINFGSKDASGTTQFSVGGGARSRVVKNVDVGVSYEVGVGNSVGIFHTRITADLIWRF
jgi:opacity protein-like surface antigen